MITWFSAWGDNHQPSTNTVYFALFFHRHKKRGTMNIEQGYAAIPARCLALKAN
jgi:hypothetical protein